MKLTLQEFGSVANVKLKIIKGKVLVIGVSIQDVVVAEV
jgi:hypothetical protein